jgi:hypothetical protein
MKTESTVATKKEETGYGGRKQELEFGGPIGVSALMIWSHYILIYFWYSNLLLCTLYCRADYRLQTGTVWRRTTAILSYPLRSSP